MPKNLKMVMLMVMDIILINLSYYFSGILRFDTNIPQEILDVYFKHFILITVIKIIVFIAGRMYTNLWRYASINELTQIILTILTANVMVLAYATFAQIFIPRTLYVIATALDILFVGGIRMMYRTVTAKTTKYRDWGEKKRVMIVGAGDAGAMLIKEINNHSQLKSKTVALIDDDFKKLGLRINGVPVMGNKEDIPEVARKMKIDEIVIAIPSANKQEVQEIVEICKKTRARLKILPGMYEIIGGKVSISQIRDVEIEDLLGREQIKLNTDEIRNFIKYKKILVTGGGGSIGSELCRQILKYQPSELIILDIYENSAYDLQNELKRKYEDLNLKVIIASVRDRERVEEVLSEIRPDIVFHAAAHKHVPLMEDNPKEAIKNNVFGTLNMAQMSDKYGVEKFVLISTDKAVNPTNIMGASKRLCEMVVQSIDRVSKTEFAAVRFGNVLGSNGSVIPLFKKQIEAGGPVTLTHPDIIRYFMSIPEAAQLVLQAGAMAKGGEIFILDMGEPVKIIDLATDLIRLSGFEPYTEIPIEITGLRPGEKLYEELLLDEEGISNTVHSKIFVGKPIFTDYGKLLEHMETLQRAVAGKNANIKYVMSKIVKTYKVYEDTKVKDEILN
ncbi:MAG: polysaccharide biosynthesis protein [Eubacteriaceae bacterium]|nr:polysaccharide biosynthesis protein [Eubacteriaceae bacterium]